MNISLKDIRSELKIKAIRSSGSGGQHVNKVSSKVELTFNLIETKLFDDEEKQRISSKLKNRISLEGNIIVTCDEERSQHLNKEIAIAKLIHLLDEALFVPKIRKASKPSKKSIENRLQKKKLIAEKKANRKVNL